MKKAILSLIILVVLPPALSLAAGEELILSKIIMPSQCETNASGQSADENNVDAALKALSAIKQKMSDFYFSERRVKLSFGEPHENMLMNKRSAIFTYNVTRGDLATLLSIAIRRDDETLRFNCILWDNPDEYRSKSKDQLAATFKKYNFDLGPIDISAHPAKPMPAQQERTTETTETAKERSEPTAVTGTAGNKSFFMFQRQ